jgi:hypothetical protein
VPAQERGELLEPSDGRVVAECVDQRLDEIVIGDELGHRDLQAAIAEGWEEDLLLEGEVVRYFDFEAVCDAPRQAPEILRAGICSQRSVCKNT